MPADSRSLNYDKYFAEGDEKLSSAGEYNSHNTERLNVEQVKKKLLEVEYIRRELGYLASDVAAAGEAYL